MTALSNSPSEIISQLLIDLSLATDADTWPVFADFAPESPDNLVSVFTTPSRLQGKDHVIGDVAEHMGFQISVRSGSFSSGDQKARNIAASFDIQKNVTVTYSGSSYILSSITRRSGILNPTRNVEDSRRNLFTFNCTTTIRQLS